MSEQQARVAELEARTADLRARLAERPGDLDLRHQLHTAVSALSRARHPERARAAYDRYRRRRYSGQYTAAAGFTNRVGQVQNPSMLRAPVANGGRCPRCSALIVSSDHDGPECYRCGWHGVEVARPLPMEVE